MLGENFEIVLLFFRNMLEDVKKYVEWNIVLK